MNIYDPSLSLFEARAVYFERAGLPSDGGYDARWIRVSSGRLPVYFFNSAPRRRAVPSHDLHHVLTGYDTSNTGEALLAAWELAAGTGPHWIAVLLDLTAMTIGLILAPRATFGAFVRGRDCRSLYTEPFKSVLLQKKVGETRVRLGLGGSPRPGTPREVMMFCMYAMASLMVLGLLIILAPLWFAVSPFLR